MRISGDGVTERGAAALWLALGVACGGAGSGSGADLLDVPIVGRVTTTSVTIAWESADAEPGSVEFGVDASYGDVSSEAAATTEHRVVLDGLSPNTTYHYRIRADPGTASAGVDHTVHTAPLDPAAPFRFTVVGDSGAGTPEESEIVALMDATEPDLVLHTGDIAYGRGSAAQLERKFLVPYQTLLATVPLYASLGNHDAETAHGGPLLTELPLPTNDVDGGSSFYSFDWGAMHVVALDSNQSLAPGSVELGWLERDLAASRAIWRIVFFHHPPYSSSRHKSQLAIREALTPILDRYHVDVVFSGHDHDYERTFPMAGGTIADRSPGPNYRDAPGTIFVVTGGGGQTLYPAGTSDFTVLSESTFHFVRVDVAGNTLSAEATRLDGSVLDRFSLEKSN